MIKWHYYVTKDGKGYWSMVSPWQTNDRYVSYVYSAQQPTGSGASQSREGQG